MKSTMRILPSIFVSTGILLLAACSNEDVDRLFGKSQENETSWVQEQIAQQKTKLQQPQSPTVAVKPTETKPTVEQSKTSAAATQREPAEAFFQPSPTTPVTTGQARIRSNASPTHEVTTTPLYIVSPGAAGIAEAVRNGLLRPATAHDFSGWLSRANLENEAQFRENIRFQGAFVVLKPSTFSGGLGGAHSVILIVHESRLVPVGDIGHSIVLFSESGACMGVACP